MKAEGHAKSAPKGEDLVCSGISALSVALADTVTMMDEHGDLDCPPQIIVGKDGLMTVKVRPKPEAAGKVLLAFLFCQTGMIAIWRGYHEYVSIKTFDKAELKAFSIEASSTLRTD